MKGQAGTEFLVFVIVLMLILSVFLWSNASLQSKLVRVREIDEARKLCDTIAFEINSAVRAGDGYSRKFYVEDDFLGISDFNITVSNYAVILEWRGGAVSSSIIVEGINGSVEKGWNLVQNSEGVIDVTQV